MPARNLNFANPSQTEQTFYENFMVESIEIYGQDIYYMPRKADTSNRIWKEGSLSLYDEAFLVCAYLINDAGPTGAGILMTKFDVKIAEEFTFIVSKREFDKEVVNNNTKIFRPNEGDAIYFPLLNSLYQIKFVEDKKPFRQLNFLSTYGLISETFQYSDERFQTGVPEIDNLMQRVGYSFTFTFTTGTGNFEQNDVNQLGEIVIGSISQARANVVKWDKPNKILEVNNVVGTFVNNDVITGFTSNASYSNSTFNTIDSENTFGDNQYIEQNATPVVAETDSIFGFISRGGSY